MVDNREELDRIARRAFGDVGLYAALVALRRVEHGRAGREFGVLSTAAPTFDEQLRIAANSFTNHQLRFTEKGGVPRDRFGWYTDEFLRDFSARWAPIDADNDPNGLNANHARNLVMLYHDVAGKIQDTMRNA